MALPIVNQPIYTMTIPSIKKNVRFRPFTVKEEKILLMAKETAANEDQTSVATIMECYRQLIQNCVLDPLNIEELAAVDLEFIFVKLRAVSISNIADIKVKGDDDKFYDTQVNLDAVYVENLDKPMKLQLTDSIGVVMRYPTYEVMAKIATIKEESAQRHPLIKACVKTIYDGNTVYPASECAPEELDAFIDSLNIQQLAKIADFFQTLPQLCVDVNFMFEGSKATKTIRGLKSFF